MTCRKVVLASYGNNIDCGGDAEMIICEDTVEIVGSGGCWGMGGNFYVRVKGKVEEVKPDPVVG